MEKILKPAQARSIYDAMCVLNNVEGLIAVTIHDAENESVIQVKEDAWAVHVTHAVGGAQSAFETYENQASFAAAYSDELDAGFSERRVKNDHCAA